jgi:hypothetical protein
LTLKPTSTAVQPGTGGVGPAQLVDHEADLAKIEAQRLETLETRAGAVLTLVLAIAAFAASALNGATFKHNMVAVGVVALFLLVAAAFAVLALGPRALLVRFWLMQPGYARVEKRMTEAENVINELPPEMVSAAPLIESWRARRAVSIYLAERKALWVTCSLGCLLLAFLSAAVASVVIVD